MISARNMISGGVLPLDSSVVIVLANSARFVFSSVFPQTSSPIIAVVVVAHRGRASWSRIVVAHRGRGFLRVVVAHREVIN